MYGRRQRIVSDGTDKWLTTCSVSNDNLRTTPNIHIVSDSMQRENSEPCIHSSMADGIRYVIHVFMIDSIDYSVSDGTDKRLTTAL